MADKPITREEKYLAFLTGDYTGELPKPITRKEKYLYELCLKGIGGEVSPEEIKNAVNEYLEKNPVKPGATTEQAQQIEQNKTDIGSLKEDLSNKITKFYASNQGETHLTDSDNGKIMDMMLYGKSEQKQYSGKNLLPTTMYDNNIVQNGITFTNNGDGSVTASGTATDTTYFTLWGYNKLGNEGILPGLKVGETVSVSDCLLQETNSKELLKITTNGTVTINSSTTTMFVGIRINKNTTVNKTYYPQIEKGSEATSYEPYTGGQPSPSPDYPQEIKSVVNPTVKVCGKNLINIPDGETTVQKYYNVDVPRDVPITLSSKVARSDGGVCRVRIDYELNGEIVYGMGTNVTSGLSCVTATVPRKAENTRIIFQFLSNESGTLTYEDTQIELGSAATPYEPYHEQTVTLPYTLNAIPVSTGGNVTIDGQQYIADYVDVERGKLVRNIENATFNGAENENWGLWNVDKDELWSFMSLNSVKVFVNESASKCNRFEFNANENIDRTFWLCNPSGRPSLQIKNRIIGKDITAFKSWLSNNPINVIYPLRIPIEEELTTEQAQALKELSTYYPVTNITVGSEQLYGYTVFNYPISLANGWNYVKQQLNDNRDYIYDMDTKTQDIDTQAAEAYVNSEYAVALTELEVM